MVKARVLGWWRQGWRWVGSGVEDKDGFGTKGRGLGEGPCCPRCGRGTHPFSSALLGLWLFSDGLFALGPTSPEPQCGAFSCLTFHTFRAVSPSSSAHSALSSSGSSMPSGRSSPGGRPAATMGASGISAPGAGATPRGCSAVWLAWPAAAEGGSLIMVLQAMVGLVGGTMGSPRTAPTVGALLCLLPSLRISAEEAEGVPHEEEKG